MFEINGDAELKAALAKLARTDLGPALERGGQLMLTGVRSNTSGRPGPNVVTGQYRASWSVARSGDQVAIGTNSPQGPRLENGFNGTDSLGRNYNQPPFAHAGPTIDTHGERAVELVFREITKGIR